MARFALGLLVLGRIIVFAGLLLVERLKGLDRQRQKVHQLRFMRFIHSGLLDRSASDAFPVAFNHEVCGFYPEGLQTPVV